MYAGATYFPPSKSQVVPRDDLGYNVSLNQA